MKSAFEIYYGRKANELLNDWKSDDDDIHLSNAVGPSKQHFQNKKNFTRQWRKSAMKAGDRKRKRILEKDSLKKHQVLIDGILKRYNDDATYLVKVKIPGEAEPSVQKVEFKILQITPDCLSKINQSKQKEKITEILFVSP